MARVAHGSLADETTAEPHRQRDDGEVVGRGFARFWDDVQSLPARSFVGDSFVRRAASVYPRFGELGGSVSGGSTDLEYCAKERGVQLRDIAHDTRVAGLVEREIFIGLFDQAFAVFWPAGIGLLERRSWDRIVGFPSQSSAG